MALGTRWSVFTAACQLSVDEAVVHGTLELIDFEMFTCVFPKQQTQSSGTPELIDRPLRTILEAIWSRSGHNTLLAPYIQPVFTHPHCTSGIKTKRTLQRGLWCFILSTGDYYRSLVRALNGVPTPNMPDLVDQKRPSFFPMCVFFNERRWCVGREKFMNPIHQIWFAFRKWPVAASEWMLSLWLLSFFACTW